MNSINDRPLCRERRQGGFTLAEVLAAMLVLAIVMPVAVEVLRIGSLAGEVAARKSQAMRVADRVLSQCLVSTNWMSPQSGVVTEGPLDFRWRVSSQGWTELPSTVTPVSIQLITAQVNYPAQGRDYSVQLSTLAPQAISPGVSGTP